jgi:hypothetical protein
LERMMMVENLYRKRQILLKRLETTTDVQTVLEIRNKLQKIEETLSIGRQIGKMLLKEYGIIG